MPEKMRYVAFILFNKDTLSSKLQRRYFISYLRASKIFKQMSNFIGTRNPSQCRSQNQKMYKRFKTVNRIVTEFKKEIGEENFETQYRELSEEPSIKFYTETEIKVITVKSEISEIIKKVENVGVQTENKGVVIPEEEAELYNLFKLQAFKSLYLNPYMIQYPQSFSF